MLLRQLFSQARWLLLSDGRNNKSCIAPELISTNSNTAGDQDLTQVSFRAALTKQTFETPTWSA